MEYFKFLYSSPPSLQINLTSNGHKSYKYITKEKNINEYPTFYDNDEISGNIELKLNNNKSLIYEYISINLYGILTINSSKKKISTEIYKESQELSTKKTPDIITNEISKFSFVFSPHIKPYETYIGTLYQIRYYIKAVIKTSNTNTPPLIEDKIEIACLKPVKKILCDEIYLNQNIKEINIGVENVIHVKINLMKTKFFLDDVIVGKIKIVKSEIELNSIKLVIKKEEKFFQLNDILVHNEDLSKYEIAEGFIEQGDELYFKYYLKNIKNLTPNYDYKDENDKNKMNVKYFLCFCFNDEQGYEFFKHIEIDIYRMNISDMDIKEKNKDFISIKKMFKDEKKDNK